MPFSVPLLDNFARADAGPPPSSNWGGSLLSASSSEGLVVLSNAATKSSAAAAAQASYWGSIFPNNQEVWVRIGATNALGTATSADELRLYLCVTNPGASYSAYMVQFQWSSTIWSCALNRVDSGTVTFLTFINSTTYTIGDYAVARRYGTNITVEKVSAAGATTSQISWTDGGLTAPGYAGAGMLNSTNIRIDNFGAGSLDPSFIASLGRRPVPMIVGPDRDTIGKLWSL